MVNYNEVFKLAVQKGYERKYSDSVLENTRAKSTEDELVYIEMSLIVKWLRDEKYIDVLAVPEDITYTAIVRSRTLHEALFFKDNIIKCEQALLEGINEALKLLPDAV